MSHETTTNCSALCYHPVADNVLTIKAYG